MKGNKWDEAKFFETGRWTFEKAVAEIKKLKPNLNFGEALGFGCGAGRITQVMTSYFVKVVGVDIAPSMIDLANAKNQSSGKFTYFLNEQDNLALFKEDTFDLVFSYITLQHVEPAFAKKYIVGIIRVLDKDGIEVF